MTPSDRECMKLAVEQAREQASRYGLGEGEARPNPLVGCVVVTRDGKVHTGYRGEYDKDDHAEYTVLEKKLPQSEHAGATVYTTLEPCTDRKGEKIPCADRLVEAKVSRVVIGYMDPDDRGRGYHKLVDANITVELFDPDLAQEIRELNRYFIDSRKKSSLGRPWFQEIERACGKRVKILADLCAPPAMKSLGKYSFPRELDDTCRKNYDENMRTSSGWCEHIAEFKGLSRSGTVIEYEEYDYVQWKTLRDAGRKPRAIYAGAIVVCPDTASIYVHKRSPNVATEPGKFHAFVGGFIVDYQNNSDVTLLNACLRELHEESSSQPSLDQARVVIVENLDIGWIDVMFVGGTISRENVGRLKGSKEGEVVQIAFDDIEQSICENRDSWVANGIAHHLIWLKLGALGAPPWFSDKKAQDIYKRICERISS